jgi:hypothetical protein
VARQFALLPHFKTVTQYTISHGGHDVSTAILTAVGVSQHCSLKGGRITYTIPDCDWCDDPEATVLANLFTRLSPLEPRTMTVENLRRDPIKGLFNENRI